MENNSEIVAPEAQAAPVAEVQNIQTPDLTEKKKGVKPGTKRGPYKNKAQEQPGETVQPATKVGSGKEALTDFFAGYQEVKNPQVQQQQPVQSQAKPGQIQQPVQPIQQVQQPGQAPATANLLKSFISGYSLLIACDVLIPGALKLIIGMFNKTVKAKKISHYKLTKEEKKELEEVADEVAKIIFANMNPAAQFMFALCFIYGGKFADDMTE